MACGTAILPCFYFGLLEVIYANPLLKAGLTFEVNQVDQGCIQSSIVNEDVTVSQAPVPMLDYSHVDDFFFSCSTGISLWSSLLVFIENSLENPVSILSVPPF